MSDTVTISNIPLKDTAELLGLLRSKGYVAHVAYREVTPAPAEPQPDAHQTIAAHIPCSTHSEVARPIPGLSAMPECGEWDELVHAAEQRATRAALEWAAEWCEQQTGDFAQYFTPKSAADVFRARAALSAPAQAPAQTPSEHGPLCESVDFEMRPAPPREEEK